jgi:8-hydroxy-5-deazaflavin:NADPH oxidoreductase
MKVAIIGSGIVGQTLGKKLVELGHNVILGTRDMSKLNEAMGNCSGKSMPLKLGLQPFS